MLYSGGFTAVFPVIINGEKWAFRCWHVSIKDADKRLQLVSEFILKKKPSYLVPLEFTQRGIVVNGVVYPTTRMKWIEGRTIKEYLCDNIGKRQVLLDIASSFLSLVENMHEMGIAHGDLQHGNILVTESNDLCLVDYDSMYVPSMGSDYRDEIKGKDGYQHPNRKKNLLSSNRLDYFSELIIYLSIIALAENSELAEKYKLRDTEYLLFSAENFKDIESSQIYNDLKVLDVPLVSFLLDTLVKYLGVEDINRLKPFSDEPTFKTLLSSYYKTDEELWAVVKVANTIESYQNYLRQHPHGRFCHIARQKRNELENEQRILLEDELWKKARISHSLNGYRNYLNDSTLKIHREEALEKIAQYDMEAWAKACEVDSKAEYRKYISAFPKGEYVKAAQQRIREIQDREYEEALWIRATLRNSLKEYRNYLNDSILQIYQEEALEKISQYDREAWAKACEVDSGTEYRKYIATFPKGKNVQAARQQIRAIQNREREESLWERAMQSHSPIGYRNYLNDSTLKIHRVEALEKIAQYDNEAWAKARDEDSKTGYRKYIDAFPGGKNVQAAEQRITRLERRASIVFKSMVVTVIMVIAYVVINDLASVYLTTNPEPAPAQTQQKPSMQSSSVSQLESALDIKLQGLELQKKRGKALDIKVLNEAKELLNNLYGNSSKYSSFKQRIDNLLVK